MSGLEPIERHLRLDEVLDPTEAVVIRGWPLTIDGILRNAEATCQRFSFHGYPLVATSVEITTDRWDVDAILSGSRLRTRRSYASTAASDVVEAGFELLPSFLAPHYSVALGKYSESQARRLIAVFGDVVPNPYYVRREP